MTNSKMNRPKPIIPPTIFSTLNQMCVQINVATILPSPVPYLEVPVNLVTTVPSSLLYLEVP